MGEDGRETEFAQLARDACSKLLGVTPNEVATPRQNRVGPPESFRCRFGPRTVIATTRSTRRALALEARVLRDLESRQVPVPGLLAEGEDWIIQEDIGSKRLSRALNQLPEEEAEVQLDRALQSLLAAQVAGKSARLDALDDSLRAGRLDELLTMPAALGGLVNMPAPELDTAEIRRRMEDVPAAFCKRNAEPSHAVICEDQVKLIDWSEAGPGDGLEDLVTMLFDESVPDRPEVEDRLVLKYVEDFGGAARQNALAWLVTLHCCRRLVMILSFKGDDDWWSDDETLARDFPVVSSDAVRRTVSRGLRWGVKNSITKPLVPWLAQIPSRVASTSTKGA